MNFKDYFSQWLDENPKIKQKLNTGKMIKKAREEAGMTQLELAKKMNTKQSAIARVESGINQASLTFLYKVAKVTGKKFKMPKIY